MLIDLENNNYNLILERLLEEQIKTRELLQDFVTSFKLSKDPQPSTTDTKNRAVVESGEILKIITDNKQLSQPEIIAQLEGKFSKNTDYFSKDDNVAAQEILPVDSSSLKSILQNIYEVLKQNLQISTESKIISQSSNHQISKILEQIELANFSKKTDIPYTLTPYTPPSKENNKDSTGNNKESREDTHRDFFNAFLITSLKEILNLIKDLKSSSTKISAEDTPKDAHNFPGESTRRRGETTTRDTAASRKKNNENDPNTSTLPEYKDIRLNTETSEEEDRREIIHKRRKKEHRISKGFFGDLSVTAYDWLKDAGMDSRELNPIFLKKKKNSPGPRGSVVEEPKPISPALPYRETPALPYRETQTLPYRETPALPYRETQALPYRETQALPYRETLALPYRETPALPYRETLALPYNNEAQMISTSSALSVPTKPFSFQALSNIPPIPIIDAEIVSELPHDVRNITHKKTTSISAKNYNTEIKEQIPEILSSNNNLNSNLLNYSQQETPNFNQSQKLNNLTLNEPSLNIGSTISGESERLRLEKIQEEDSDDARATEQFFLIKGYIESQNKFTEQVLEPGWRALMAFLENYKPGSSSKDTPEESETSLLDDLANLAGLRSTRSSGGRSPGRRYNNRRSRTYNKRQTAESNKPRVQRPTSSNPRTRQRTSNPRGRTSSSRINTTTPATPATKPSIVSAKPATPATPATKPSIVSAKPATPATKPSIVSAKPAATNVMGALGALVIGKIVADNTSRLLNSNEPVDNKETQKDTAITSNDGNLPASNNNSKSLEIEYPEGYSKPAISGGDSNWSQKLKETGKDTAISAGVGAAAGVGGYMADSAIGKIKEFVSPSMAVDDIKPKISGGNSGWWEKLKRGTTNTISSVKNSTIYKAGSNAIANISGWWKKLPGVKHINGKLFANLGGKMLTIASAAFEGFAAYEEWKDVNERVRSGELSEEQGNDEKIRIILTHGGSFVGGTLATAGATTAATAATAATGGLGVGSYALVGAAGAAGSYAGGASGKAIADKWIQSRRSARGEDKPEKEPNTIKASEELIENSPVTSKLDPVSKTDETQEVQTLQQPILNQDTTPKSVNTIEPQSYSQITSKISDDYKAQLSALDQMEAESSSSAVTVDNSTVNTDNSSSNITNISNSSSPEYRGNLPLSGFGVHPLSFQSAALRI